MIIALLVRMRIHKLYSQQRIKNTAPSQKKVFSEYKTKVNLMVKLQF